MPWFRSMSRCQSRSQSRCGKNCEQPEPCQTFCSEEGGTSREYSSRACNGEECPPDCPPECPKKKCPPTCIKICCSPCPEKCPSPCPKKSCSPCPKKRSCSPCPKPCCSKPCSKPCPKPSNKLLCGSENPCKPNCRISEIASPKPCHRSRSKGCRESTCGRSGCSQRMPCMTCCRSPSKCSTKAPKCGKAKKSRSCSKKKNPFAAIFGC